MNYRYLLALLVVLASCGSGGEPMTVTLSEFSIDTTTTRISTGENEIEVLNRGQFAHTLVVNEAEGRVLAATRLLMPGESTTLTVGPSQGRLMFTCRIVTEIDGGEIIDHYQQGMVAVITAGP